MEKLPKPDKKFPRPRYNSFSENKICDEYFNDWFILCPSSYWRPPLGSQLQEWFVSQKKKKFRMPGKNNFGCKLILAAEKKISKSKKSPPKSLAKISWTWIDEDKTSFDDLNFTRQARTERTGRPSTQLEISNRPESPFLWALMRPYFNFQLTCIESSFYCLCLTWNFVIHG